jgi:hypothetical protein
MIQEGVNFEENKLSKKQSSQKFGFSKTQNRFLFEKNLIPTSPGR